MSTFSSSSEESALLREAGLFLDSVFSSGLPGEGRPSSDYQTQKITEDSIFAALYSSDVDDAAPMEVEQRYIDPLQGLVQRQAARRGIASPSPSHQSYSHSATSHTTDPTKRDLLAEFLHHTDAIETRSAPIRSLRRTVAEWDLVQKGAFDADVERRLWRLLPTRAMQKLAHDTLLGTPGSEMVWDLPAYTESLLGRWRQSKCGLCGVSLDGVRFMQPCRLAGQRLCTCPNAKCACQLTQDTRWAVRHLPLSFEYEMGDLCRLVRDHLLPPQRRLSVWPLSLSTHDAAMACLAVLPLSICGNYPLRVPAPSAAARVAPIYYLQPTPSDRPAPLQWEYLYTTYAQFQEERFMLLPVNLQRLFGIDMIDVHRLWERTMGQYLIPAPHARWNTPQEMDLQKVESCFVAFAVVQWLGAL